MYFNIILLIFMMTFYHPAIKAIEYKISPLIMGDFETDAVIQSLSDDGKVFAYVASLKDNSFKLLELSTTSAPKIFEIPPLPVSIDLNYDPLRGTRPSNVERMISANGIFCVFVQINGFFGAFQWDKNENKWTSLSFPPEIAEVHISSMNAQGDMIGFYDTQNVPLRLPPGRFLFQKGEFIDLKEHSQFFESLRAAASLKWNNSPQNLDVVLDSLNAKGEFAGRIDYTTSDQPNVKQYSYFVYKSKTEEFIFNELSMLPLYVPAKINNRDEVMTDNYNYENPVTYIWNFDKDKTQSISNFLGLIFNDFTGIVGEQSKNAVIWQNNAFTSLPLIPQRDVNLNLPTAYLAINNRNQILGHNYNGKSKFFLIEVNKQ